MQFNKIKHSCGAVFAVLGLLGADIASAGTGVGSIVYAPLQASPVPTLSGWMLAIMGLLIAVMAFRVMRAKNIGGRTASLVSAAIIALGAAAGNELVTESKAALAFFVQLDLAGGGQAFLVPGQNEYRNTSGVPQRITGITISPGYHAEAPSSLPVCVTDLVLSTGSSCYLNLVFDVPAT